MDKTIIFLFILVIKVIEWNDVEKALGALGIKIRDSVDNFRNFDDVMAEIASKWDSYSDVQQSGIATALAGTR